MGSGKQWTSWIHLRDEVGAMLHIIENDGLRGVFNLSSPAPVRNREFYRTLGRVLGKQVPFGVPGFVLRAALGEVARELILPAQRVVPSRLLGAGYVFSYSNLEGALREFIRP